MVDTGLLRKNEFEKSYKLYKNRYNLNVKLIKSQKLFYKKLKNVVDPEKKRKIIGNLFIKIFEKEAIKFKNVKFYKVNPEDEAINVIVEEWKDCDNLEYISLHELDKKFKL